MFKSVASHIFSKQSDLRKEIGEIMDGRILDLESERLLRTGKEKGEEKAKLDIAKNAGTRLFSGRYSILYRPFKRGTGKNLNCHFKEVVSTISFFVSKYSSHICYIFDGVNLYPRYRKNNFHVLVLSSSYLKLKNERRKR